MNITDSAFIAAGISGAAVFWGQARGILARIMSVAVVSIDLQGSSEDALVAYCWKNFKTSRFGDRRFTGATRFIKPKSRQGNVGFEMTGKHLTFWNGWRPLFVAAAVAKDGDYSGEGTKITFLRGTFDIDNLLAEAIDHFDEYRHGKKIESTRFYVRKVFGKAAKKDDERGQPASLKSERDSNADPSLRPLRWKNDELGQPTSKAPFDNLAYGKSVEEFEKEIKRWFRSEQWFKERGLPWRFGGGLYGPPGCHARGTKILMYDGTTKNVEEVKVGDQLMGPDSTPRKVLSLANGIEPMLEVTPTKGDPFVVNVGHIFHLTPSGKNGSFTCPVNISGRHLLEQISKPLAEKLKLTKTGVSFTKKELPLEPYILGLWLGDGTSSKPELTTTDAETLAEWKAFAERHGMKCSTHGGITYLLSGGLPGSGRGREGRNFLTTTLQELDLLNNKHIPHIYKASDRGDRLQLLAGLLDSDGHSNNGGYEITQKNDQLASDILFLARSLGLAAYSSKTEKFCQTGGGGVYNRIYISGNCADIPVKIARKKSLQRNQIKNVLRTGFTLEILPEDEYFGFSLDGDHLYLTADFTIHHNTGKTSFVRAIAQELDMPVHVYDLTTMSNEELTRFWDESLGCAPCVVLFEDIDRIFDKDKNVKHTNVNKSALTFDCLLNCIQGVQTADGILVLVTANDVSKVDPALGVPDPNDPTMSTRPGRLDRTVHFGILDEESRLKIAKRILAGYESFIPKTVAAGVDETGAQFESRCAKLALEQYWQGKAE